MVQRRLPPNPFAYILVGGFANAALCLTAVGLVSGLVLVAATLGGAAVLLADSEVDSPCAGVDQELADIWNEPARAQLRATLVGTVFLRTKASLLVPVALTGFAASLGWLALVESLEVAYAAIFCVGLFYLLLPTSLATAWQEHVDGTVRGRVAALWVLAFGGVVPIGNILAGPLVDATSLDLVLGLGAVAAVVLAITLRIREGEVVGEEFLDRSTTSVG